MLIDISWIKYMSSGDSILAILIGLLGAFLLRILSRLMEVSTPFHVSHALSRRALTIPDCIASQRTATSPSVPSAFTQATTERLKEVFPKALTNKELVHFIRKNLKAHGYGNNSLVATSLCCDEVNRVLENDLKGVYGSYFCMGGLAGTPFGGVTAFGAM